MAGKCYYLTLIVFRSSLKRLQSKQSVKDDGEDVAQAGVNKASKGGIIYGDYLQVNTENTHTCESISIKSMNIWIFIEFIDYFRSQFQNRRNWTDKVKGRIYKSPKLRFIKLEKSEWAPRGTCRVRTVAVEMDGTRHFSVKASSNGSSIRWFWLRNLMPKT